ncbi:MAG: hypothetical protein ACD_67C00192G0001, partial [uncultured bacterium]
KIIAKFKAGDFVQYYIWAILLLASGLRFTGLLKRDFWYDESFTGIAVKESFSEMIQMIINDVHPPLYYASLKLFSSFFDYNVFGIRLFSAIFGVLSVWAVYIVAKELFNRKAALWSSFIVAISPFAIQYSQEARMYSMLVFLILISSFFFLKGLRTGKRGYFIFWGIFTGLSILTHYMGIIFSSTYFVAYLFWAYFQKVGTYDGKNLKEKVALFVKNIFPEKNIILGYLVALVVFLPWIGEFKHHLVDVDAKGNLTWVKPASLGDTIVTMQMFLFGTPLGEMSSGMPQPNEIGFKIGGVMHIISHISIRMVLAVLFGMTIVWILRKEKREKISMALVFSAGFLLVVFLFSLFSKPEDPKEYFVARYLLPGAYFFFIYIGVVLSHARWSIIAGILGLYLFLLSGIVPLSNSTGYNEMISHLDKYKNNNFYILNSFDYVITKYYLGADRLTLYNYDWPQYNPDYWAAIGYSLKRTENFNDLKSDPNALIISNKKLNRDNQYFSTEGLVLVNQYKNILIYKFQK